MVYYNDQSGIHATLPISTQRSPLEWFFKPVSHVRIVDRHVQVSISSVLQSSLPHESSSSRWALSRILPRSASGLILCAILINKIQCRSRDRHTNACERIWRYVYILSPRVWSRIASMLLKRKQKYMALRSELMTDLGEFKVEGLKGSSSCDDSRCGI